MNTTYVIEIEPIGKPRMTRADKWKQRTCVVNYRLFADKLRAALNRTTKYDRAPLRLNLNAYLALPDSWSKKKKTEHLGQPHRQKPDIDNITKAVFDSLFEDDSAIAGGTINKFWDDGRGPRLEITFIWE